MLRQEIIGSRRLRSTGTGSHALIALGMCLLLATPALAADLRWTNADGDGLWSNPDNWVINTTTDVPENPPGEFDRARFQFGPNQITINQDTSVNNIWVLVNNMVFNSLLDENDQPYTLTLNRVPPDGANAGLQTYNESSVTFNMPVAINRFINMSVQGGGTLIFNHAVTTPNTQGYHDIIMSRRSGSGAAMFEFHGALDGITGPYNFRADANTNILLNTDRLPDRPLSTYGNAVWRFAQDNTTSSAGLIVAQNAEATFVAEGGPRTITISNGSSTNRFIRSANASEGGTQKLILSDAGDPLTLLFRKDPGLTQSTWYVRAPIEVQTGNTLKIELTTANVELSGFWSSNDAPAHITGAGQFVIDQDAAATHSIVAVRSDVSIANVLINAGTLRMDEGDGAIGSITSNVTVADGATFDLAGLDGDGQGGQTIGSLAGSGTVALGGAILRVSQGLAPGQSAGTLTIDGSGDLFIDGVSVWETGDLLQFASDANLTFAGTLDVTAMDIGNHLIADLNGGSLDYSSLTLQGNGSLFEQDGDLWVNVIPEPASAMLLLSGAMMMFLRTRTP